MKFASGKFAFGKCGRCGDKVRYSELRADGDLPQLRVCSGCYDIAHPAEKPFRADDAVMLQHPAPDIDDDSAGDTGESLVEALGLTNNFGGNT